MRTLFIGDVHGCYDELIELTQKIQLTPEDHLYFVGDLINKWPKSLEVVKWVQSRPNTFSVTGNHEYFSLKKEYTDQWQGSLAWIENQYAATQELREVMLKHWYDQWLLNLPVMVETDEFILVHAWLHPDFWSSTPPEIATIIRIHEGRPWYEYYTGKKKVIYGHWAVDGLRIRENTIWLDTGCCFGGHLTAYCLESGEIWQVHAHDIYKIPADHKWKIEKIKSGN